MIKEHHKYYKNKILAITYWTQVNKEHATLIPNEEEECHGGFSVTKPKIILINELNNNKKKKKWKDALKKVKSHKLWEHVYNM